MPLVHHTYGKSRVRMIKVRRTDTHDELREISVSIVSARSIEWSFFNTAII